MVIEAFLLCDAATQGQGKLNVLGAFDSIFSKKMPVILSTCSITTRIRFEKIEDGDHPVKIHIINEDGKNIGPKPEGNISVKTGPGSDSTVTNVILNIQNLKFEEYGIYRIDLAIDDNIQASLPLRVAEPSSQA